MKMNPLGRTDIQVSQLTLGTMTFGTQTPEDDAMRQMDMAYAAGINSFDTAELYPVLPITYETQGESERILGRWVKSRGNRDKVVVMTKVSGIEAPNAADLGPIRREKLMMSLERSLNDLQTDYVDLYQLHWPNRGSYSFRKLWNYEVPLTGHTEVEDNFLEVLQTLDELIKVGKIRAIGVSNEGSWGVMKYLELSKTHNLPRMSSVQNEYSMIHRIFEPDMQEVAIRENVGLLSYTSLGGGLLSGKYGRDGSNIPEGSRRTMEPAIGGRVTPKLWPIIAQYLAVAAKHGLDPVHMAYRFCITQDFLASVIIGASRADQLEHIFKDDMKPLSSEVMEDINILRKLNPIPL